MLERRWGGAGECGAEVMPWGGVPEHDLLPLLVGSLALYLKAYVGYLYDI